MSILNIFQWNFIRKSIAFIHYNAFENLTWIKDSSTPMNNPFSYKSSLKSTYSGSIQCLKASMIYLTQWGRVTHICVDNLNTVGSDNGLSPDWPQAIIWTNAGILLIQILGTNFSEILNEIYTL